MLVAVGVEELVMVLRGKAVLVQLTVVLAAAAADIMAAALVVQGHTAVAAGRLG